MADVTYVPPPNLPHGPHKQAIVAVEHRSGGPPASIVMKNGHTSLFPIITIATSTAQLQQPTDRPVSLLSCSSAHWSDVHPGDRAHSLTMYLTKLYPTCNPALELVACRAEAKLLNPVFGLSIL
ncbi:hypothetical protein P7K49_001591 [Saguinus oedipus]|uniref:Uncharacterized protein n=1 Tax=Saguinus oedipus TaxID=9490 RepID=A0ABQ9WFC8_SAGOE|nr:hypothetical protein P7K49_001591 [Saguinus oedipus]